MQSNLLQVPVIIPGVKSCRIIHWFTAEVVQHYKKGMIETCSEICLKAIRYDGYKKEQNNSTDEIKEADIPGSFV